ncbi:uncharacterized protein [Physcomitrium patens]|uniref:Uncharacterized protein n=1 Tax=Physcomitrium patens TaxID=3218 RepID=A0A2K1L9Q3_PHYPA|nr:eukaryotic translation initiation factor 5B-like isoform X2 [Physcomitrium patens]PNR62757.1 hypothetical protein PHYPA_001181 [Physcomitrium patens]|eukprot:XP_024368247.1 eukaryotic translation initiation factor 5B-like isoform X2 [Physcomitrella patens]
MDKGSTPAKTKPVPKDSDDESETSDEETEDEEQAEGGSEYESESDESTDTTKKKLTSILPTKQQSAIKASAPGAPGSPAKRTREANWKKDKEDEPLIKKKKPEVAASAAKSASKPAITQTEKKKEIASKTERAKSAPKEKQSKESAENDMKKSAKRKAQSPAAKSDSAKPTSSKSDGETPQKTAKPSRPWLPEEETTLSKELQLDRVNNVYGNTLPAARADPYWEKLMNKLSFMDKYDSKEQRIERLCEKVRRMRLRYEALSQRIQAGETNVWKNEHEGTLWRIWHTIWGPNKATAGMLNGDDDDDEEEEEDDEDEEEEEEEEIEPTQIKGRQPTAGNATAQKKAVSKNNETSLNGQPSVKGTPPAVPAAPVASALPADRATEATVAAEKQSSASKAVPVKEPAPTAMEVDLNTSGKDNSNRGATPNGHVVTPPAEQSAKVVLSDELRAENLAFLRDMRSTCIKMVEEARTQSLVISEKMLVETRAKTTQIVEEAREKSSQIMEELRLVAERLGAVAGQGGRMKGSGMGSWTDFPETSFPARNLLWLPLGEQNPLEDKWHEQSEAEQVLLLKRLQLVQEQARIQQESIRLKISLQTQQSKEK